MKIYIAAKYHRRHDLRGVVSILVEAGHEVTSRWISDGEGQAGLADLYAAQDLDDVAEADVLLFIGEQQGSKNTGGGRWFEFGVAFNSGKRCMAVLGGVGDNTNLGACAPGHESVFTSLPSIEVFNSIDEAIVALG